MISATYSLSDCLSHFCESVNHNPDVAPLLKGWEPNVIILADDSNEAFTLYIRNCKAERFEQGADRAHEHIVEICAKQQVLCGVFSGQQNAASKFLQGELAIFGTDKDQVKLDAIALLVWDV